MTTTYFANCIMGNLFHTKETPTLPTAFYVGLSSTEPNISGENVSEPSDKAYARVQLNSLSVHPRNVSQRLSRTTPSCAMQWRHCLRGRQYE